MHKRFCAISGLFLAAALFFGGPLWAQLDPRLQAGKTDFLNLYQQSATIKPKPEIVSVFDFSSSMDAIMFHPVYQNQLIGDEGRFIPIDISLPATGAVTNVLVANLAVTVLRDGATTDAQTNANATLTLQFVNLIRPDGEPVTQANAQACQGLRPLGNSSSWIVSPPSNTSSTMYSGTNVTGRDVRHWVMAASHIRFKCIPPTSGYAEDCSYARGRTIDIPLPWKVMEYHTSSSNPVRSKTIKDVQTKSGFDSAGQPVTTTYGSGLDIEYDLTYQVPYANGNFNHIAKYAYTSATGGGSIRFACYPYSYIHWLFAGRWQSTGPNGPTSNARNDNHYAAANGMYYTNDATMNGKFIVFDADASSSSGFLAWGQTSADQGKGYRGHFENAAMRNYKMRVPKYKLDGTLDQIAEDYAYRYTTPAVTRVQANKVAAIQTWIKHQADVFWAFRYLDWDHASNPNMQHTVDYQSIHGSSRTNVTAADANTVTTATQTASWMAIFANSNRLYGMDCGWCVLNNTPAQGKNATNGNSVNGMRRIAATFSCTNTPITCAMAGVLAQLNDANNIFNDVIPPEEISQCSNTYVIFFTDGIANDGATTSTPYLDNLNLGVNAKFSSLLGNRAVINNKAGLAPGTWFNIQTFAALGAHMADASLGEKDKDYMPVRAQTTSATKESIRNFLPFAIKGRKGVDYASPRRVTTMTVGVSLGGRTMDFATASNPKSSLFLTALMGDTSIPSGTVGEFHPFVPPTFKPDGTVDKYNDWLEDPSNPIGYPNVGKKAPGAVYYFDATDPDTLSTSLDIAFKSAISVGSNNASSTPNIPFVGASFGGQVYMGNFNVPDGGGANWTGDLLMFGIREEDGQAKILGKDGVPTQTLDSETAIWAASKVIKNWKDRRLYTRLPRALDTAPLKRFTDTGDDFANATTGLKNFIKTDAAKAIQFASGGDTLQGATDSSGRPLSNRGNIMGDIINSEPAAIEYSWPLVSSEISKYPNLAAVSGAKRQFRLILVGTNQGWLHAFGEVSTKATGLDGKEYVTGSVEELWSFMPTDFLENLDYITRPGNIHRFMVDGVPVIYHLDIPTATESIGDGIVNMDDKGNRERVLALFGLGKGGRSYYALNIEDPFNPKMQWTLIPDEATSLPAERIEPGSGLPIADVRTMLSKWGFSTATPAFGRVVFDGSGGKRLKDAVFLSGGFSVPEVDEQFVDSYNKPIGPLGRSIMALDVYTGKVLAAVDLATVAGGSSAGPVGMGLVPFEFINNSGTAQRAYFVDYSGGLWAWGSDDLESAAPFQNFRIDTSEIGKWKVRKVYQDTSAEVNRRYTTAAAPFRVANFPGEGRDGSTRPAAVGIAMVSGDRNNPLDYYGGDYAQGSPPDVHRLTVVFDRQDNNAWLYATGVSNGVITDAALKNFTNNSVASTPSNFCADPVFRYVTPGCDDFYLAPKSGNPSFGYFIDFPSRAASGGRFAPKGINPPMVVSGSVYYTIFFPASADPCSGGHGVSRSYVVADAINPLKADNRSATEDHWFASGLIGEWGGVASNFIQRGTRGVLQGGIALGDSGGEGIVIKTAMASPSEGYPKPRVWRVVR